MSNIDILYEDKSILVLDKPAGVPVQTARAGLKDIESMARSYRKQKGEPPEIYVVHRLDQPVSGILLMAKTSEAAAKLSKGLDGDSFSKKYRAEVYLSKEIPEEGTLRDYLLKDKSNTSKVVPKGTQGAKEAILSYHVVEKGERTETLEILLKTGRHHQIRVQLSSAGVPILGDLKYGSPESIALSKGRKIETVALSAVELEFIHPETGKPMKFAL
ncbi:MAG: RluA family pseudouridine synthase [Lachnospiraceae bacterium]|nr:RluA family pseudouridine synthase [Lachnospiraceae bacterium]